MPKVDRYLKGFNIRNRMVLAGHELQLVIVDHNTVQRYKKYKYPTKMVWKNIDSNYNSNDLINALSNYVSGSRTIYTKYGNPYECTFGELFSGKNNNIVIIHSIGECNRILLTRYYLQDII